MWIVLVKTFFPYQEELHVWLKKAKSLPGMSALHIERLVLVYVQKEFVPTIIVLTRGKMEQGLRWNKGFQYFGQIWWVVKRIATLNFIKPFKRFDFCFFVHVGEL